MKLGIVGLPNVGKSTLFNAITNSGADSANYPFCTIDPNIGIVHVPDFRIDSLAKLYNPKKITYATVEFVDIAGLVRGASKGEGLGNKFLSHIRAVDAIVHVVRCFEDSNIIHVEGDVDPIRDIETINTELILSDIELLERRIDKVKKLTKGDKNYLIELEVLERLLLHLNAGQSAHTFEASDDEKPLISEAELLSSKPVIFAANLSENDFAKLNSNQYYLKLLEYAKANDAQVLPICAKLEQEISELSDEDKTLFLQEIGIEKSGLDRLILMCYSLLGLISFLTAGEPEVRAWTISRGLKAPQAAGKIHSDFERGFIRAEIISFEDLMALKSMTAARDKGLVRSEGKNYVMQDGDVVLFRFNV